MGLKPGARKCHQRGFNSCHVLSVVCSCQLSEKLFFSGFCLGFCKWIPSVLTVAQWHISEYDSAFLPAFISLPFKDSHFPFQRGHEGTRALSGFIHLFSYPPSPQQVLSRSHLWLCPAALNEPLQGHLVSVSRPCTRSPGHAYFLDFIVGAGKKKKRCWLTHTFLPPSLPFSSNPQGDGREWKQSELERCSEEAIER